MLIPDQTSSNDQKAVDRERKTVELCGEARAGHRCILSRGHDGHHECHTPTDIHRWK